METIKIGDMQIGVIEEMCFSEAPAHEYLTDLPADAVEKTLTGWRRLSTTQYCAQ